MSKKNICRSCGEKLRFEYDDERMQLALLGYGKMGKMVETSAKSRGHLVYVLEKESPIPQEVDLCIDFSSPLAVERHVDLCIEANKPLVIGTTGWEDRLQDVRARIQASSIGALYSPNFSIAVNLFCQVVRRAARTFGPFFDLAGLEIHHTRKQDRPSGTAKALTRAIEEEIARTIEFASLRVGDEVGEHTLFFDSPHDRITLSHQAKSRQGFAHGSVLAAEWLVDKQGFFTMEDFAQWMLAASTQH